MPDIKVDKDAILEALKRELNLAGVDQKITRLQVLLKTGSFNPFARTTDGTVQGWHNLKEANQLLGEILDYAITAAEKTCADAGAVALGKEKLDAVVKFLDECIKLPFYLELFDGPMIRFAITQIINLLNAKFGNDWAQRFRPAGSL